jgi:hypothetical protein
VSKSRTVRKILFMHKAANGLWHKVNGPAIVWDNGDEEWWVNGELHRLNGPAVVGKIVKWYANDKFIKIY